VKLIPTPIHTEKAFEEAIESQLFEKGGYIKGNPDDFNRELALDTKTIFAFLHESQPEAWEKSLEIHGTGIESKLLQRMMKELDNRGALDVLRNGFVDYGVRYKMAYFKPASGLNPEAATKLDGLKTKYLPFNLGYNKGAGNPPNPDGYKTSYLWEYIWEKDSWMDILGRFLHLHVEEFKFDGKNFKQESMLFPRLHQLDVVRKLEEDARTNGPGKNYLIEHSAGSGKSNSIAWLAYRISSLHDKNDKRVFDSVIVVTDRLVLDQQLQNTIYQFEHKQGVVQKIDKNSTQLAKAIGSGTNIIITTLQKFPFVLDKIGQIPARNYAVIVDEAHSSQSGEAAKKLNEAVL